MIAENQSFAGKKVNLDGASFYACEFEQCTILYSGLLPAVLDGCSFKNCQWKLSGPALRTMFFLKTLYQMGGGAEAMIENTFLDIRSNRDIQSKD